MTLQNLLSTSCIHPIILQLTATLHKLIHPFKIRHANWHLQVDLQTKLQCQKHYDSILNSSVEPTCTEPRAEFTPCIFQQIHHTYHRFPLASPWCSLHPALQICKAFPGHWQCLPMQMSAVSSRNRQTPITIHCSNKTRAAYPDT